MLQNFLVPDIASLLSTHADQMVEAHHDDWLSWGSLNPGKIDVDTLKLLVLIG